MNIKPLQDRIVVRPLEPQEKHTGEIIVPDSAREKPLQGEVVAIGEELRLGVRAGDRILYGKHSGSEIILDGNEYLIMREDEILGILESLPGNDPTVP